MSDGRRFDLEKAFFVMDSCNLEQVQTMLYGFTLQKNTIVQDAKDLQGDFPEGVGAYVYIHRTSDSIRIFQDFLGSYGLYLYRCGDYFALSNSFLYLVDHVKKNHPITLNGDYANFFVCADLCSVSFGQTMIQEIECLDRCAQVEIRIPEKSLQIRLKDYEENTVAIGSAEGMAILDAWYEKWTSLIRSLHRSGLLLQTDLSGGFDSRMTFTLFLGAGIDLNSACIKSINDGLHVHNEDFAIATQISRHFGFQLNKTPDYGITYACSAEDMLNVSFYLKLGFHKQMYLRGSVPDVPRHSFSGSGGECLRAYWNMTEEEYIEKAVSRCNQYPYDVGQAMAESVRRVLQDTFDRIRSKFASFGRTVAPEDMTLNLYRETRCRNHFGKDILDNYFGNNIKYAPLLDPMIHKLKLSDTECTDKNLLAAVLWDRYQPELLEFPIEGGRSIREETISYARSLNRRFRPAVATDREQDRRIQLVRSPAVRIGDNIRAVGTEAAEEAVKQLLQSELIREPFSERYGTQTYDILCQDIQRRKYQPLQNAYVVIAIGRFLQDIRFNRMACSKTAAEFLLAAGEETKRAEETSSLLSNRYLENYVTARIDIIKTGNSSGGLEITEVSDPMARITVPGWLKGNSCGYVVESPSGCLTLSLRCKGDGTLTISPKSRDVRRKNGTRIPFWIDYSRVMINGQLCTEGISPACHDQPLSFSRSVSHGEIIQLEIQWDLHDEQLVPLSGKQSGKTFIGELKRLAKRLLK